MLSGKNSVYNPFAILLLLMIRSISISAPFIPHFYGLVFPCCRHLCISPLLSLLSGPPSPPFLFSPPRRSMISTESLSSNPGRIRWRTRGWHYSTRNYIAYRLRGSCLRLFCTLGAFQGCVLWGGKLELIMGDDRDRDDWISYAPARESSGVEVGDDGEEGQGEELEFHGQVDLAVEPISGGTMNRGWVGEWVRGISVWFDETRRIRSIGMEGYDCFIPLHLRHIFWLRPQFGIISSSGPQYLSFVFDRFHRHPITALHSANVVQSWRLRRAMIMHPRY